MASLDHRFNRIPVTRKPESGNGGGISPEETAPDAQAAAESEIDLQALAKKIYDLLREDLRVERERLGRSRFR